MDKFLDKMTSYAQELKFEDIPQDVVERAKHFILDAIGCALGASKSPPAIIAQASAKEISSTTPSKVLGSAEPTSPDLAAFVNGAMIRYLDYNDTYTGYTTCHPSDMVGPALAAASAKPNGNGKDVILGTVLGYEILCGLTDTPIFEGATGFRHWDQSALGLVAASVLSAKVLGLNKEQMDHAVSLAVSSHLSIGQIRTGQISHWKGCAVGNASRNGVFCSMLAAKGMTGPNFVFEGEGGYFNAIGNKVELPPFGNKGGEFKIMRARVKPFPSGYFSQSAIEAVLELRDNIKNVADIKSILLETFPSGKSAMGGDISRWKPETRESADHSLPFVMAVALMDGNLEIRHYDEEYYKKDNVRELMSKIQVEVGEESSKALPDVPLNVLSIETNSGEKFSTKVAFHLGHYERLMTNEQLENKFRPMALQYGDLPENQLNELLSKLWDLESVMDIDEIIELTATK